MVEGVKELVCFKFQVVSADKEFSLEWYSVVVSEEQCSVLVFLFGKHAYRSMVGFEAASCCHFCLVQSSAQRIVNLMASTFPSMAPA